MDTCFVCFTPSFPGMPLYTTPCGHHIHMVCFVTFACNELQTENPVCCIRQDDNGSLCNQIISSSWINQYIGLTRANKNDIHRILNDNYIRRANLKACPLCQTLCSRKNPAYQIVRCLCFDVNRKEFCFFCGKIWRNLNSNENCGNPECDGKDPVLSLIENCEEKDMYIGNSNYQKVPIFRLCMYCATVLKHVSGCKEMTCLKCKKKFCWICLSKNKDAGKGGLTCGGGVHYGSCTATAPRQNCYPVLS